MRIEFSPERLAALQRDYEADSEPLAAIAARFDISPATLRRIACDMGFALRPPARPFMRKGAAPASSEPAKAHATKSNATRSNATKSNATRTRPAASKPAQARQDTQKPAASPDGEAALRPLDLTAMARRVQASVETELTKVHIDLEGGADVEKRARALASLVRTLGDLARLEEARAGAVAGAAADGAWNIDDLRAEIARRLDRMSQGEPG